MNSLNSGMHCGMHSCTLLGCPAEVTSLAAASHGRKIQSNSLEKKVSTESFRAVGSLPSQLCQVINLGTDAGFFFCDFLIDSIAFLLFLLLCLFVAGLAFRPFDESAAS